MKIYVLYFFLSYLMSLKEWQNFIICFLKTFDSKMYYDNMPNFQQLIDLQSNE